MKKKQKLTIEQGMYITGIVALVAGMPLIFLYLRGLGQGVYPPCLLYEVLGVYCPGCGGSRALRALFSGHILLSLMYHPLVVYTAVIYLVFMISQTLQIITRGRVRGVKFHPWFLYGAVAVIAVNMLLKNILKFGYGIVLF